MNTWATLLAAKDVQKHSTSKKELDSLRALIARDLKDAVLTELSADRRFATDYNAALQSANLAIACEGHRITARIGHHQTTIDCIRLIFGASADPFADYLESCRRKRNKIDYMNSKIASESEADEMVKQAKSYLRQVEHWIEVQHPALRKFR